MFFKLDKFASMITFSHISCFSKNAWTGIFKSTSQKKCKLCFVSRVSFKWKVHFAEICLSSLTEQQTETLPFQPFGKFMGNQFCQIELPLTETCQIELHLSEFFAFLFTFQISVFCCPDTFSSII